MTEADKLMEALLLPATTRETFFLLYSRLLQVRCGATQLEFAMEGVLSAVGRNGKAVTAYLDNLWLLAGGGKEGGRESIEHYVEAFSAATEEALVDPDRLLPAVRDERYVRLLDDPSGLACRHLVADLWVVFVADGETSIRSLSWEQLEEAGIGRDLVEPLALLNLEEALPAIECFIDGPSFVLTAGADYSSSLLLVDEVWESLGEQVDGDVVAVAPTRGVVLCTGAGNAEGLSLIRQRALELYAGNDHVVSATLLRRVAGRWKAFD